MKAPGEVRGLRLVLFGAGALAFIAGAVLAFQQHLAEILLAVGVVAMFLGLIADRFESLRLSGGDVDVELRAVKAVERRVEQLQKTVDEVVSRLPDLPRMSESQLREAESELRATFGGPDQPQGPGTDDRLPMAVLVVDDNGSLHASLEGDGDMAGGVVRCDWELPNGESSSHVMVGPPRPRAIVTCPITTSGELMLGTYTCDWHWAPAPAGPWRQVIFTRLELTSPVAPGVIGLTR